MVANNKSLYNRINIFLFVMFFLSILPTVIFGIMNNYTQMKTIVWIWDVISIFVYMIGIVIFIGIKKINKSLLKYLIIFVIIVVLQYITYLYSIQNNLVESLYTILPITYFLHFINTFVLINSVVDNKIKIDKFIKLFLFFVLLACIYNLIKNYQYIFNINSITSRYINISSFFQQRNAFGQLCFFGIVANTYLLNVQKEKNKKIYIITYIVIFANLIFSFSRTSIFSTLVFIFTNIALNNMKINKKSILKIFIALVFCAVSYYILTNNEGIMNFLNYYIFREQDGLSGRSNIWEIALSNLYGWHTIIGYGLGSSPAILKSVNLYNSHNTYIELLLTGGCLLLSFYVLIYAYILKNVFLIKNKVVRNHYLSFILAFLIYTIFEKVLLFGTGYAPVMFTIFLINLPLFDKSYYNSISEITNGSDHR